MSAMGTTSIQYIFIVFSIIVKQPIVIHILPDLKDFVMNVISVGKSIVVQSKKIGELNFGNCGFTLT